MTRSQLNIDHVARVEGHGNVHVVIEDDVVKTVEMNIVEPARLFESMVRGQSYKDCSYISSRICGICSPSHCVTDLKAVEDAFGIEVSPRTKMLRELLVYGSYLQNHASHLFVFVVPDFVGEESVTVQPGARFEEARQRSLHARGRALDPSHHGSGGRFHA